MLSETFSKLTRATQIAIALLAVFVTAAPAIADDDSPDDAAQFAVFCGVVDNFSLCSERVFEDALIDDTYPAPGDCAYSTDASQDTSTANERQVIDWLESNPQPPGTKTDDAIQTAMNALWPC